MRKWLRSHDVVTAALTVIVVFAITYVALGAL